MRSGNKSINQKGFTLVELVIGVAVLGIISISIYSLFQSLISSALLAKRKSVALSLATNQMEYLKSLSYNDLAIAGGSIYSTSPLPASKTQTINGVIYTIKTDINYIDDAFDGCTSYPNETLKQTYCRNYPPPNNAPATDQNPADYKVVHVAVYAPTATKLADVDTQISARVAETASTTGALFVKVIDDTGNSIPGATVQITNSTLTPVVNASDSSDSNGIAIFYNLPPDTANFNYVVNVSKAGYSSLYTLPPSGSLQPTYQNSKVFTQQSSFVTLTINPQGANSLAIETTDVNGNPLGNVKLYAKGGYKKYSDTTDTSYYFDNMSPTDTRITSNASGNTILTNLAPGGYWFCGDAGATGCSIGGTSYYLAAAVPYGGSNLFSPINIPRYSDSPPPSPVFSYAGVDYLQKVRLLLTANSSYPRILSLTPESISLVNGVNAINFEIKGVNLPCDSAPNNCNTIVRIKQGSATYTAACTGTSAGLDLDCVVDATGITAGSTQVTITANGFTLTIPGTPLLGGINVTP